MSAKKNHIPGKNQGGKAENDKKYKQRLPKDMKTMLAINDFSHLFARRNFGS